MLHCPEEESGTVDCLDGMHESPKALKKERAMHDRVTLKVYKPIGAIETKQRFADRLPDLNGKTICELSNGAFEAARIFPFMREVLEKKFPNVKIVPYTEFPNGRGSKGGGSYAIDDERIVEMVRARGGDAVITGNAA